MSETNTEKNRLPDEELETVSGGSLKIFEACVHEIQQSINEGKEEAAALQLKFNYAALPQMTKVILAQRFREKFHHSFTESPFYKQK